jgi:hypothetical protein
LKDWGLHCDDLNKEKIVTVIPHFNRGYYYDDFIGCVFSSDPLPDAQKVFAEAQNLQKQGKLEAARLRYQQTLGLQGAVFHEDKHGIVSNAVRMVATLTEEINQKRAEAHPRLNQRLDMVVRNQPLDEAIRAVVEAGGFQLDLVDGSLEDAMALQNLPELREPYLDFRPATVWQGLELLIAPYHLTWQMKDADTITVGTTRRFHSPSAWEYAVADLVVPLEQEISEETVTVEKSAAIAERKSVAKVVKIFLKAIRTITGQKTDSILTPGSAMLIDFGLLVVYAEPETHAKVQSFIRALRDSRMDIVKVAGCKLPSKERTFLKELQKLTIARWKSRTGARKKEAREQALQRVNTNLATEPWQLLSEAIRGEVDLRGLTMLQIAWDDPHITKVDSELVMRSAWCITAAAQAVPTNTELVALSEKVLSTVKDIKIRKPRYSYPSDHLAVLYAGLVSQDGDTLSSQVDDVIKSMAKVHEDSNLWTTRIIAEGLFSPSARNESRLLEAILAHEIRGDDHVLLTSLIAKRRGGQLWETFSQEMPDIVEGQGLYTEVEVILNQLEESELAFLPE